MASYPGIIKNFGAPKASLEVVEAAHLNAVQEEIVATQTELGVNTRIASGGGLAYDSTPNKVWTNLVARLANIENGITADVHSQYLKITGGTVTSTATGSTALVTTNLAGSTVDIQQWKVGASLLARVDSSGFIYEGVNRVYSAGNPPPAVDLSDFVRLSTAQTIAGAKTFSAVTTHNGGLASTSGTFSTTLNVTGALTGTVGTFTGTLGFTNELFANGKQTLVTNDTFLRINQASAFPSGIWLGTSPLKMGGGAAIYLGSNGGNDGQVAFQSSSADNTRRITLDGANGGVTTTGALQAATVNTTGTLTENGVRVYSASNPQPIAAKVIRVPHTFAIPGDILVPSGQDNVIPGFFVPAPTGQTATFRGHTRRITSGTSVTFSILKNGVSIGADNFVGNTTKTTATAGSGTTFADTDELTLVVSAVAGSPKNFSVTVYFEYTV